MKRINITKTTNSIRLASFIQLGSKFISIIVQLIVTMVLARLLTPEQYGVVAVLTAFSALFTVISDAGISTAVAQFQSLKQSDYERLFFVSFLLGFILTIGYIVFSFAIAWFYDDTVYVSSGCMMSFSVLFNALNMVPNGVLLKERKFTLIGLRLIVCNIVVGCVVVALAFMGAGVYSIVLQSVLTSFFILAWNLASSHLKMSVGDIRPVLRKVGRFSAFQLGNDAIVWLSANADSLLAGKMFGEASLGYYNKAYSLYGYPLTVLAAPITSTLIPFLSPLQKDVAALRAKYLSVVRKVSFIVALCSVWMNVCAVEVIQVMYGPKWNAAIPLLEVLALAIYARGVNSVHAPLLSAAGRSDLLMRSTTINTMATFVMILLGGALGSVQSLATCVAIAYNFELVIPVYLSAKYCLQMNVFRYFLNLLPDIVTGVAVILLSHMIPWHINNIFFSLFVKASFVLACMIAIRWVISISANRVIFKNK